MNLHIYIVIDKSTYKFTYKCIFLSSSHSCKRKCILFCNFQCDIISAFCFASTAEFIVQLTRNENAINLKQMQHLQCNSPNAFQFQLPIYNCDFHMNVKVNCPLAGAIFSCRCLGSWLCVCVSICCVCASGVAFKLALSRLVASIEWKICLHKSSIATNKCGGN